MEKICALLTFLAALWIQTVEASYNYPKPKSTGRSDLDFPSGIFLAAKIVFDCKLFCLVVHL